ncbi:MAG: AAA family ATPase [bacterium]
MKLHKLSLHNWRGISHREITFDAGVTLLEGPNEVGKSSIIEAIQLIFSELDSSNKKQVKSIQPAGQDVGSEVRIEFSVAGYHLTYAKTYNKNRSTTAHISGALHGQETGRSAHEWVANLLAEHVDMTLWQALLVDQGEQINQIKLNHSVSLAQALDSAAGAANTPGSDDDTLINAAQREYETYFTLKTGRIKYKELLQQTQETKTRLAELIAIQQQLEQDQQQQQTTLKEVERLRQLLPQMQQAEENQGQRWQALQQQQARLTAKQQALADVEIQLTRVNEAMQTRADQLAQIQEKQQAVTALTEEIERLSQRLQQENTKLSTLQAGLTQLHSDEKEIRQQEQRARADLEHLDNQAQLARHSKTLEQIRAIEEELADHLNVIATIKVDAKSLAAYVQLEQQLAVAEAKAQVASTDLTLSARQALNIIVGDQPIELKASAQHRTSTSSTLLIELPDLLDITIAPPASTTDLANEYQRARDALQNLQAQLGVSDLQSATTLARQRSDREAEVQQLKSQQHKALQDLHISEIEQQVKILTDTGSRYIETRPATPHLPADRHAAADIVALVEKQRQRLQRQIDEATQACQRQVAAVAAARQALDEKVAAQQANAAACEALTANLESQRQTRSDTSLAALRDEQQSMADTLRLEIGQAVNELAQQNIDAQKLLLENAADSVHRTSAELRQQEQALAILNDRLETARANGLHERIVQTEAQLQQLEHNCKTTIRRAEAASRLWETLNRHRDATRQAYLQPLKQQVETLGRLVFGATFAVEVAQDWSITHRTLGNTTLAFEDLSIGAKEQLAILMRLAAAQLVAQQNGIPLFIDDALGFSDPQKLNDMGAAIAAAGRTCQIIILTCAPGRYANVGNAKLIKLSP